jgi:hypothetical protein
MAGWRLVSPPYLLGIEMSKKQPKLTGWMPADVMPVRIGGYRYRYGYGYEFDAWWDGIDWLINDKVSKSCNGEVVYSQERDSWRGLAQKPT